FLLIVLLFVAGFPMLSCTAGGILLERQIAHSQRELPKREPLNQMLSGGAWPSAGDSAVAKTATKSGSKQRTAKAMKVKKSGKVRAAAEIAAGDQEVTIDRRRAAERREESEDVAPAPKLERRQKVNRRRQIDPTTCERDYTDQEVEFMNALDDYKRKSGRMFPTCSEVLEVIHSLGYVKVSPSQLAAEQASHPFVASARPMPEDVQASIGDASAVEVEQQLA